MVSIKAGPCAPIPKADLPRFLPEFLGGVLRIAHEDGSGYDVVHSHYWLSGWVGRAAKELWDAPLVLLVPHAGQGEELLARPRGAARAGGPDRGRAAR